MKTKAVLTFRNQMAIEEIGSNLETWRRLRGIPVQRLAEQAQVSRTTISRLLHGNASVSLATFVCVCRGLGVLDKVVEATDPSGSELARARASSYIPARVRASRGTPKDGERE